MTAVVFVHGAWHGAWVWDEWLRLFRRRGYAPRTITLRGHADGTRGYRGVGLSDYCADVARELDGLPAPPIVVGHSLGGLIIQHLLAERRLPAAVLLAPIPGRYPAEVIVRNALRHPIVMARANVQRDLRPLVSSPERVRELLFTEQTPESVIDRCQARLTGAWPGLFREMVATAPPPPLPGTPTLVMAPTHDRSFTVERQRALATTLGAEFEEVAGCGHDVPLDGPWRDVSRRILAWLETNKGDMGT